MTSHAATTLDEALFKLSAATGHRWRQYEFFNTATHCRMSLHAVAPDAATTTIHRFDSFTGAEKGTPGFKHSLAMVFPNQVDELARTGKTSTEHPVNFAKDAEGMEWFTQPIDVTAATLRVPPEAIKAMLDIWRELIHTSVSPSFAPVWMWKAIPKEISASRVEARRAAFHQRRLLHVNFNQRAERPPIHPALPYVGPAPKTEDLGPRVLWLMDYLFRTREEWFGHNRTLRRTDVARQVYLTLMRDGTRGQRRAKVSESTIARMTHDWQLPASS